MDELIDAFVIYGPAEASSFLVIQIFYPQDHPRLSRPLSNIELCCYEDGVNSFEVKFHSLTRENAESKFHLKSLLLDWLPLSLCDLVEAYEKSETIGPRIRVFFFSTTEIFLGKLHFRLDNSHENEEMDTTLSVKLVRHMS